MSQSVAIAPRWPRDRWISPTVLKSYRTCPFRVRLQYLDKVPQPPGYNVFLAKGRVAHLALRRIADALSRGFPPIDDEEVMRMTRVFLPIQEFPSEDARLAEGRDIVRWVGVGRRYIEAIPNPDWVLVEKNLTRPLRMFPKVPPYTLMARPDAIVQRHDHGDETLFEIIDYKTGKRRPETMPPVIMRFVARDLLKDRVGDASRASVRFSYLWLETGERDVIDLSVAFCNEAWEDISDELRCLAREAKWTPTPSFLCRYCPYHQNVCTEQIPYDGLQG